MPPKTKSGKMSKTTKPKPKPRVYRKKGGNAGPITIPSFEIENLSGFDQLNIQLKPGESVMSQAGAVAYIDGDLKIETQTENLLTSMFAGTTLFKNLVTAPVEGNRSYGITLSPIMPGSIINISITDGQPWILSSGCLLACTANVQVNTDTDFKGLFTNSSIFLVELSVIPGTGDGMVWASSYGGAKHLQVSEGQKLNVDNGMFMACQKNYKNYQIVPFNKGSLWGSAFSGEGLMMEFTGPAYITVQSRNLVDFLNFIKSNVGEKSNWNFST